jgi:hypothetical protein
VADAAGIVRVGEVLLTVDLLAGDNIPEAELGPEPATVTGDAADHQRLHAGSLPRLELRRGIERRVLLRVTRLLDRQEIAAALEVVGDDAGDQPATLAGKIGDRDRHRLEGAFAQVDHQLCARRSSEQSGQHQPGTGQSERMPAGQSGDGTGRARSRMVEAVHGGHSTSLASKLTMTSRQSS